MTTLVPAKPGPFAFDLETTALVVIDMQRDFLEPGGFGAALGNDVSLLNERWQQSFTRVAEDVTQSRRHFFHIRPVERVARHHRLDGLVGLIVVADRHETQRPVQVDGLAVLRRRTGREQRIQHRQRAAVVGRSVELTGVC